MALPAGAVSVLTAFVILWKGTMLSLALRKHGSIEKGIKLTFELARAIMLEENQARLYSRE